MIFILESPPFSQKNFEIRKIFDLFSISFWIKRPKIWLKMQVFQFFFYLNRGNFPPFPHLDPPLLDQEKYFESQTHISYHSINWEPVNYSNSIHWPLFMFSIFHLHKKMVTLSILNIIHPWLAFIWITTILYITSFLLLSKFHAHRTSQSICHPFPLDPFWKRVEQNYAKIDLQSKQPNSSPFSTYQRSCDKTHITEAEFSSHSQFV